MTEEPIEDTYFRWLCAKVQKLKGVPTPSLTYWKLFQCLHSTEYVWLIANDDNRVEDGLELRTFFLREAGYAQEDSLWYSSPCSFLEMLIAFAYRAEFSSEENYIYWFWKFIDNLGFTQYCDGNFYNVDSIQEALERVIFRLYESDGRGGLFPLKNPQRDQRNIEIWYQFCDYLVDLEV